MYYNVFKIESEVKLMARKNINTTIDEDLYLEIRMLALKLKVNGNDLIEEGMKLIIERESAKNKS